MAAPASSAFVPLVEDARPAPRTQFDRAFYRFLDDVFAALPTWATSIGYHAYDDRWPDLSDSGRGALLAMLRHHRARLATLAGGDMSADERVDLGIVLEAIDAYEFEIAELREHAWDPLRHVYLAGNGLFSLLATEFGPWAHRGAAFVGRLEGMPRLLEQAHQALVGLPDRPVSLLHTDTALAQISGINELIEDGLQEAARRNAEGNGRLLEQRMKQAAEAARAAVARFEEALREEVRPRASGEGRLGESLFAAKLRHTLATHLTPAELLARARNDYDLVRAEMVRLARQLWPTWRAGRPLPTATGEGSDAAADARIVREVLDAIAAEHRRPDELIDWCRAEIDRIDEFCRGRRLIEPVADPLQITWTPTFMRAYGRAFLYSPGPLDRGLDSHFWITPPDESLGRAAVDSYLREDNDRMLSLLCIHEGVPGHYLQLTRSNECARLARAIFSSGIFAEGWAVYVTQVMMDHGYGADDPALMLTHWKFYLRAITNVIIDVEIHTADMSEQQALELMVDGGFQEEDEARAKWLRARLTSTQLSTYYVGSLEMWELELAARRRAAKTAGGRADAVESPRLVGALGDTPGFDHAAHLDAVLSHGSPPPKWVRRLVLEEEWAD